ncbi:MAG TPA: 30S ribosomal protein S13 [Patescibacteria group bacterium]|nr:30S ribosomal protein S13 [Patescibacteria group bacterium]
MAIRIAGTTIPNEKRIEISLTYIFGIGQSMAQEILNKAQVDKNKRASELVDDEVNKIREIIENEYKVEGDLRREVTANIKRLKEIGCYRGERHSKSLPMRGQRTKINAKTARKRNR